jgi:hypothetical protein
MAGRSRIADLVGAGAEWPLRPSSVNWPFGRSRSTAVVGMAALWKRRVAVVGRRQPQLATCVDSRRWLISARTIGYGGHACATLGGRSAARRRKMPQQVAAIMRIRLYCGGRISGTRFLGEKLRLFMPGLQEWPSEKPKILGCLLRLYCRETAGPMNSRGFPAPGFMPESEKN